MGIVLDRTAPFSGGLSLNGQFECLNGAHHFDPTLTLSGGIPLQWKDGKSRFDLGWSWGGFSLAPQGFLKAANISNSGLHEKNWEVTYGGKLTGIVVDGIFNPYASVIYGKNLVYAGDDQAKSNPLVGAEIGMGFFKLLLPLPGPRASLLVNPKDSKDYQVSMGLGYGW